ncbi:MAG: hypothetical protein NVV74_09010 [Magnetospirillum sp.]|nr:hypothetical protein [Magnetospirillum sp.]
MLGQGEQAALVLNIAGEQLLDHGGLGRLNRDACRIAGAVGVHTVAVRGSGPGQEASGAQLHLPASSHTFGDQGALIFGDRTPDLQQQVILWVPPHRSIQKLDPAAKALQFLQEHHQLDVVARQPVGVGDQDPLDLTGPHGIAQSIQARTVQRRPAVSVIPEDVLAGEVLTARVDMGAEPVELLLDGLGLRLTRGRDAHIGSCSHRSPPLLVGK